MLVEITPAAFGVEVDLAYATPDNFTGRPIYRRAACFLLPEAAEALRRSVTIAAGIGLGLRVYDAFRPVEAQWALWNHTPDPNYVPDQIGRAPWRGRGCQYV